MDQKEIRQIPLHIGHYFAGFADGEGSFNVSLRKKADYGVGWQLCPSFNISQKDPTVLFLFKRYLKCGTLRKRPDGVMYYEVLSIDMLWKTVIPFFEKFQFLSSSKKTNFSIFRKIMQLMYERKHLTREGFNEILRLREIINEGHGRTRKYNINDVHFDKNKYPQRLYAEPPPSR
ncbi:MAG: LAGLIDADG family homing endonuclease [Patescibacteria group bacterium]